MSTNNAAAASTTEPVQLLTQFCKESCSGNVERAGLVLGRPPEELEKMMSGELEVDEDLVMKIRGIAQERNLDIQ